MSKLYIFDCDRFVPTDGGGMFSKGRREFALQSASAALVEQVGALVAAHAAFAADRLPSQALRVLQNQGLVKEVRASQHIGGSLRVALRNGARRLHALFFRHAPAPLAQGAIVGLHLLRRGWAVFANRRAFTLLSAGATGAFARHWAALTGPATLAVLALSSAAWLAAHPSHLGSPTGFTALGWAGKLVFFLCLAGFVLFHESAHAAAAYRRLGFCGGIRFALFYGLPYLRTGVPEANTLARADRVAISASGSILQVCLSILALAVAGHAAPVKAAAELSIAIALVNWLPWLRSDGYWILSDLAGGPLRLGWRWGSMRPADVLYSALTGVILAGIVALLVPA